MSVAPSTSRLALARRRVRALKVASAGVALAGFAIVSVLVRGSHPAGSVTPTASSGLDLSARLSARTAQQAEQSDLLRFGFLIGV